MTNPRTVAQPEIGDPTFNCKLCDGMPGESSEFKKSVGKVTASLSSQTVSIDLN